MSDLAANIPPRLSEAQIACLRVIQELTDGALGDPPRVELIHARLGKPYSSTYYLISRLIQAGYARRDTTHRFTRIILLRWLSTEDAVVVAASPRRGVETAPRSHRRKPEDGCIQTSRAVDFGRQQRKCLRCGKLFASEGAHNRMCAPCRTRPSETFYDV